VARVLAKANRGIAWITPAGFCVVHETREPKTLRISTSDRTFVVYQEDETRKIDSRKQADGIVAHLVHSLHAAHIMLTVNRLQTGGVHHFAMVHDSLGVHAGDIDTPGAPAPGVGWSASPIFSVDTPAEGRDRRKQLSSRQ
jgi:DNA-directed RNA polymerase